MSSMPEKVEKEDTEKLRQLFEKQANDSFNFRRSRKGNYVNPAVARDWKWFQLGAQAATHFEKATIKRENDSQ